MRVLALLLFLLVPCLALAQVPENKGLGYSQAGRPRQGARIVITSTSTTQAVTVAPGDPAPLCFPFGALVSWKAKGGEVVVAYSLTSSVTFEGAVDSSRALRLTDPERPTSGPGAAFTVAPGERVDKAVPSFQMLFRSPGARDGMCSPTVGAAGYSRRPACRVNGDCTDALAGSTCDLSTANRLERLEREGCAFAVVQADTADASITWEIEE